MATPKHAGGIDLEGAAELWATPNSHERTHEPRDVDHGIQLANQADIWQTPAVDSFRSRGGDRVNEMGLDQQARLQWRTPTVGTENSMRGNARNPEERLAQGYTLDLKDQVYDFMPESREQWVTPAARDHKGANSALHATETGGGRKHMAQLSNQVGHSFLPAQQTETPGEKSSQADQTSRRRLNVKFVEWLQGLPEGFTSPGPISSAALETWLSRSRERLRCLSSSIE